MERKRINLSKCNKLDNNVISVIIPVYNGKDYLKRCLDSITHQTYSNLDIIIVDDGSTDGSNEICDRFADEDKRIRVIHKCNGGLSSARNMGLEIACGDYISFVDCDDWIDINTYKLCLKVIKEFKADIVGFGIKLTTAQESEPVSLDFIEVEKYFGEQILEYYMEITTQKGGYSVCKCLFSKASIGGLRFREGKVNEDIDFKFCALEKANIYVECKETMYYYFQSGDSLSIGKFKHRDYDLLEAATLLQELSSGHSEKVRYLADVKVARTYLSWLCKIALCGCEKSVDKQELVHDCIEHIKKDKVLLLKSPISISRKILLVLFLVDYKFAESVIRIIRKMKPSII